MNESARRFLRFTTPRNPVGAGLPARLRALGLLFAWIPAASRWSGRSAASRWRCCSCWGGNLGRASGWRVLLSNLINQTPLLPHRDRHRLRQHGDGGRRRAICCKTRVDFRPSLERVRDVLRFALIGALLAPIISAVVGATGFLPGRAGSAAELPRRPAHLVDRRRDGRAGGRAGAADLEPRSRSAFPNRPQLVEAPG